MKEGLKIFYRRCFNFQSISARVKQFIVKTDVFTDPSSPSTPFSPIRPMPHSQLCRDS